MDAACGLHVEPGDDPQERGLATARRPQKTNELTAIDGEFDIFQRLERTKVLVDAGQFKRRGERLVQNFLYFFGSDLLS